MTPEELIQAYYDGDEQAFERLEPTLRGWIRSTLLRWPLSESRRQDLIQEVLLKIILTRGGRTQFCRNRGALRPWVHTITKRTAMVRPPPATVDDEIEDGGPGTAARAVLRLMVADALDCLAQLQQPYAEVFERRLKDEALRSIGESMGQNTNWAAEKERTARRRLQKCMSDKGYQDARWTT